MKPNQIARAVRYLAMGYSAHRVTEITGLDWAAVYEMKLDLPKWLEVRERAA